MVDAQSDVANDDAEGPTKWYALSSSRVSEARYDPRLQQIQVIFKDGTPWVYEGVPQQIWSAFVSSESPGRYINMVLNNFSYHLGGFSYGE